MNVTQQIRQLEQAGFSRETLDRAIALAGGSRLAYAALCAAVEEQSLTPEAALHSVERQLAQRRSETV